MSWLLPLAYLSVSPILETAVFNLDCCLSAFKIAMQTLWLQSGRASLLADVVFLEQAELFGLVVAHVLDLHSLSQLVVYCGKSRLKGDFNSA